MLKRILITAAALAAGLAAIPTTASAAHDPYYDRGGHYEDDYYDNGYYDRDGYDRYERRGYRRYRRGDRYGYHRRCGSGTAGAIVGGLTGASIGQSIDRGGRRYRWRRGDSGATGAIIGGAVGALLGREIARSGCSAAQPGRAGATARFDGPFSYMNLRLRRVQREVRAPRLSRPASPRLSGDSTRRVS